jgi:molybdate transport system ATP-binding protein
MARALRDSAFMDDQDALDPRKIAAVVYDDGVAVDELLLVFVGDLANEGVRVGGVVQLPRGGPGCGPAALLRLRDISSGEVFPICQDRRGEGGDCCLDPLKLREAGGRILAATRSRTDLVLISRFGKEEARGQGFREEWAGAVLRGRPVLTAVRRAMVENWFTSTGGIGTLLDARLWVLKDWWRDIAARHRPETIAD